MRSKVDLLRENESLREQLTRASDANLALVKQNDNLRRLNEKQRTRLEALTIKVQRFEEKEAQSAVSRDTTGQS